MSLIFLPLSNNNGKWFFDRQNGWNCNGFDLKTLPNCLLFPHIWIRISKSTLYTFTVNYPYQETIRSTLWFFMPYAAAALEQWMAIDQCRIDLRDSHSNSETGTKTTSSTDPFVQILFFNSRYLGEIGRQRKSIRSL